MSDWGDRPALLSGPLTAFLRRASPTPPRSDKAALAIGDLHRAAGGGKVLAPLPSRRLRTPSVAGLGPVVCHPHQAPVPLWLTSM